MADRIGLCGDLLNEAAHVAHPCAVEAEVFCGWGVRFRFHFGALNLSAIAWLSSAFNSKLTDLLPKPKSEAY